jgi:CO/xanthine dehydrogenase Mo-binding subunit
MTTYDPEDQAERRHLEKRLHYLRDWQGYPILTMRDVPHVEVELIDRPAEKSLGAGEGSQGPAVAAIVNAFADATGKRIRELPLTPDRVKAALG